MWTAIGQWLLKFGLEKLISIVVSFFAKKRKHKDIDDKHDSVPDRDWETKL